MKKLKAESKSQLRRMLIMNEATGKTEQRNSERKQVIKEIQGFASEYAHAMTKDGVTRDVVVVEHLLEFLQLPEEPETSTAQLDQLDRFHR